MTLIFFKESKLIFLRIKVFSRQSQNLKVASPAGVEPGLSLCKGVSFPTELTFCLIKPRKWSTSPASASVDASAVVSVIGASPDLEFSDSSFPHFASRALFLAFSSCSSEVASSSLSLPPSA